ncbi:MAG: gliding motility-associated-like protein, partial [Glaciecola sp.]
SSSGAVSDVASATTTGDVGTASGALAMNGTHIGDEYPEDSTATTSYASNVTGTTTDALTYTAQGTHVITWSFDDGNGNVITVNQNVIITDTTNPEATCPPDVTVSFDTNCQYSLLDYTSVSSATDNCSTSPAITFTQNPGLGTVVTGSTVITIIAEDELGNTGTCTFNNIVIDDINPEISCSTDTLLAPLDENGTITLIPGMFVNSADQYPRSDNCQIESFGIDNLTGAGNLTFSCSNINEDQSIELIVTDESGNFSSCEAIVMIVDTISPLPICNDFVLWTSSEGPTVLHALSYLDTLYNNCPDNALTFYLTQDAFTPEDMGDPILQTVTVIDQSGNVGSCVSEVTIINGESIMTCPLDTTLYLDEFGSNLVMFNDLMTVTDIFLEVQIDPEDYLFALGVDSIIYDCSNIGLNELTISITNSSNHPASCTFNINLVDNIAPVIICQETEVQVTLDGDCRFEIADYLTEFDGSPNFNLTDNCTSYGGTVTQSLPAGTYEYSAFTNGNELPVILSATDSTGNVGTCAINYVLTGAVSPLVECTNDTIRIAVDADSCEVILNDNTLEAPVLQSCVALYPVTYETTTGAVSLDVGFHSVRWEVKDVFEQEASCIQVIEIYDNTIPEITCPLISVQCLTPDLDALVDPEVTDNCINGLSLTKNMSNILSTYSINWIVTDISGNADSSCIQIIEKVDSVDIPYAGEDQVLNSAFSGILIGNTPEIGNPHWITDGDATIYDPTSNITNISNLSIGENKFEYELREEGCESRTDSVIVTVTEFFIPTGFSPNGDGVNDELIIQGILANPQSELMIFDRMGKKVLSEKGYQNDWDGTAKSGALLPRDTYFYILEIPGATSFKGSIEIKY